MKCIVTGATGHIGNILVRYLHERGDEVTAFVLPREDIGSIKSYVKHVRYGDIRDVQSLEYAFEGQDIVYHLAGVVDIGSHKKTRALMYEVNVQGVQNVVRDCQATHISRLVYTSSVHAITELPHGQEITEIKVFNPASVKGIYAKSKAEATVCVLEAVKQGLDAVIVHPAGVIGPDDHQISNIGQMVLGFLKGNMRAYISGGYNFVDARDVAMGILKAADKGLPGECYILSGEYHSVKDLLQMMEDITSIKAPRIRIPRWLAYIASPFSELHCKIHRRKPLFTAYSIFTLKTNSNFSSEKAKTILGYTITPFRKTLEDTLSWMAHHKLLKSKKDKRNESSKHRHAKSKTISLGSDIAPSNGTLE